MHKTLVGSYLIGALYVAPFVLIAASYSALPSSITVFRSTIENAVLVGSKSPFMLFRVPLMNLIHGLMAVLMLSYAAAFSDARRKLGYYGIFATLLAAIGFKSTFEGLEISAVAFPRVFASVEHGLGYCTFASVVVGICLAAWQSRKVPLPWPELQMSKRDKLLLCGLFGLYIVIVSASLSASHRLPRVPAMH
jgi:hypothetical protein